jgi:hypothetical protein
MSRCLNDSELQAVADTEAPPEHSTHAKECPRCAERLAARIGLTARATSAAGSSDLPPRVREAIQSRLAAGPAAGATTLRPVRALPRWAWGVPVAAAATIVLLMVVVPGIDRQTTVSAAEVLGRSQAALTSVTSGIEVLTYDLELAGVLGDLVPEEQSGRFTVQELVDHDHDGRYRVLKLAANGEMVGGAADDPLRGTRARYMRANGRGFLLRFDGAEPTALSLPALKRTALQTFIGLMQASSPQTLREVQRGSEGCYVIDIPGSSAPAGSLLALERARAVVTVTDARLVEFSAAGRVADRPFTIDFELRSRELRPAGAAHDSDFDIGAQPGDVVLQGNASNNPIWDVVARALGAIPATGGAGHSSSQSSGTHADPARARR